MRDSTVGRPLSYAIAVVGVSQIVSIFVSFVIAQQWNESFATVSNVAYIASGCYHNFYQKRLSGSLANPAFPLLFLGVSSFAFHEEPQGHQQKHSFDIVAGLIVVLHLGCTAIAAAATEMVSEFPLFRSVRKYKGWVDIGFVLLFAGALLLLEVMYTQVYANQLWFYIGCASSASLFAFFIRVRLSKCRPCTMANATSVGIALFESLSALGIAGSAVFLQGELLGKPLSYSANNEPYINDLYDLYHGCWHIQLGLVVSLLNVRFADILEQTTEPVDNQSYITELTVLDVVGLTVFAVQACVLFVMKEAGASAGLVGIVLSVGSALHALHIGRLLYITYYDEEPITLGFSRAPAEATAVAPAEAPSDVAVRPLLRLQ